MASYLNIEKNRLHKNRHIGYAEGLVYRIEKTGGGYYNATLLNQTENDRAMNRAHFSGSTLRDVSERLYAIAAKSPYAHHARKENPSQNDLETVINRLSRARKATVAKLIPNLESPMSRRPNPAESVRILRAANPPALIWEFDGEPTSPKALLADNPDNGDVAAAVAYLKAESAQFSMGQQRGAKSTRSWSAVSFGGGAADESVLTVRADWTDGPVFKAVLDACTIPYAGDLPDADSPFSHRAGSDNYQDDFLSDFEEYDDGDQ